ncbi:toll/interleukin-1 receptor domain-containing protein [Streptomyces sp. HNM0575]|uniref:toll/interleukin-1 receptor domain-containing protein n=1 Tax=Streptomyces sp. HNM0575 TaxID=2716338 RepID=UPI00145DB69E|nr:toll/interleukin-1 receptor domain-containing protein [Streptomyces sp. HNM0575]NLU73681.1 toll/interleukin-1 receptor domain-containing protein [Streptomyces sp. HNM0575]
MPDVFVNYRTGDGEEVAATIERELSHRFGDEVVFRDSKSIPPGGYYPDALLDGLHGSSALLVVIGPKWLEWPDKYAPGRRALENEDDWVRKEILEGFSSCMPVIPILVGQGTAYLEPSSLPKPLARLAYLQALPYDVRQAEPHLARIGDALTDLVPGLAERDHSSSRESEKPDGGVHNSDSSDGDGPRTQARDIRGSVTTTHIANSTGPMHTGTGDQHNHNQSGGDGTTFISGDNHGGVNRNDGRSGRQRRDQP